MAETDTTSPAPPDGQNDGGDDADDPDDLDQGAARLDDPRPPVSYTRPVARSGPMTGG